MENIFFLLEGDFKDDKMKGYGKFICTNGNIYKMKISILKIPL
jgi:hypothetical protein